jgi:hypothetical protein
MVLVEVLIVPAATDTPPLELYVVVPLPEHCAPACPANPNRAARVTATAETDILQLSLGITKHEGARRENMAGTSNPRDVSWESCVEVAAHILPRLRQNPSLRDSIAAWTRSLAGCTTFMGEAAIRWMTVSDLPAGFAFVNQYLYPQRQGDYRRESFE